MTHLHLPPAPPRVKRSRLALAALGGLLTSTLLLHPTGLPHMPRLTLGLLLTALGLHLARPALRVRTGQDVEVWTGNSTRLLHLRGAQLCQLEEQVRLARQGAREVVIVSGQSRFRAADVTEITPRGLPPNTPSSPRTSS